MQRPSFLLLLVASAAACAAHPPHVASADQARADEAQIRASLAAWVQAFNGGDYARAATVWAPDLDGWSPDGPDDTYAAEQESTRRTPDPKAPRVEFALTVVEVIVSGDLAVVRDQWTQTVAPAGGAASKTTFRSFEVWRRQPDGSWKIARWIDGPTRPQGAS